MRLSKASLVAAALALSTTCELSAVEYSVWNGGKTGYRVELINGVPVVFDENGVPFVDLNGVPDVRSSGDTTTLIGGSGVWDGFTRNWQNGATQQPEVKPPSRLAYFGGTAGIVLVRDSANTFGGMQFDTAGYTLVGYGGRALTTNGVVLSENSGATTIYNFSATATQRSATGSQGTTLVINNTISTGVGQMFGGMSLTKTGSGALEYGGFYGAYYGTNGSGTTDATTGAVTFSTARRAIQPPNSGLLVDDSGYHAMANLHNGLIESSDPNFYNDALSGKVVVQQGILQVKGYLNTWYDLPSNLKETTRNVTGDGSATENRTPFYRKHMAGASSIVLIGSAELNFANTPMNAARTKGAVFTGGQDTPLSKRYNYVKNLRAGELNDQFRTTLNTGLDESYRIVVHIDIESDLNAVANPAEPLRRATVGSIGIVTGRGDLIKTGKGELLLLNDLAPSVGRVQVSDGVLKLLSATGRELANVRSVNLAGGGSAMGEGLKMIAPVLQTAGTQAAGDQLKAYWQPGMVQAPDTGKLVLTRDSLVQNLQADFAFGSGGATVVKAVQQAAGGQDISGQAEFGDEALIAGTGAGSSIFIGDSTLTIRQQRDGVYEGSIIGAYTYDTAESEYRADTSAPIVGRIVKTGAATLVLSGSEGRFAEIEVQEGRLVAGAAMLGQRVVTSGKGEFSIYQANAGTLNALISGSGTLRISSSTTVDNGSGAPIEVNSFNAAGYLQFGRVQTEFTGDIVADSGITLQLSDTAPDAIAGAASVTLLGGAPGRETTLSVGGGKQHVRNLSGSDNTWLSLDRGVLVLNQTNAGAFTGKITGVGSLVKSGGATMTLDASKTAYFGATVVAGGKLGVGTANGLARSSGLILQSGGTFAAGDVDQTFGALFGESGTTVDMGRGTLTIGLTAERNRLLTTELAGGKPLSADYLGTLERASLDTVYAVSRFDTSALPATPVDMADATRIFLRDVLGVSNGGNLDFAGDIIGSGGLIKTGNETLTLTGVTHYTGATVVRDGTLRVTGDAIGATSGVSVDAGALLSFTAPSGTSKTVVPAVSGDGALEKIGAGEITLEKPLALVGEIDAREGTLRVTLAGDRSGAIRIAGTAGGASASDAALVVNQANVVTVTGAISGDGLLVKEGVGTLTVTGTGFGGDATVRGGVLALGRLPTAGDVTVDAGARFEASASGVSVYSGRLAGAGDVRVADGVITLTRSATTFTGQFILQAGTVVAGADDLFPKGRLVLGDAMQAGSGATFDLNATVQSLSGLSGSADSIVRLNSGLLNVVVAEGATTEYAGVIEGHGMVQKEGAGRLRLTGVSASAWSGQVQVNEGVLEANPLAIGVADVALTTAGTFALYNERNLGPISYANAITGDGTIGKTGDGVVNLTNVSPDFSGTVRITAGELRVPTGSLGGRLFPSVNFDGDGSGIFAVVLPGHRTLDAESATNGVSGFGSLAVEGDYTLTLKNGQSFTGNTILRDRAKLDITDPSFGGTLNGLAGELNTEVINGAKLTINQNVAGVFAGSFRSPVALTVTNSLRNGAKLSLDTVSNPALLGGVSTIRLAGGHLVLDAGTAAPVTLEGGTLYFDTTHQVRAYAGSVTGTGSVVKTGANDLVLDATATAAFTHTGPIGVDQGRLTLDASRLNASITGLQTSGTGDLSLTVDSGTGAFSPTRTITGNGQLTKVGDGKLLFGTAAAPYTIGTTGLVSVERGVLGGRFATSGDLTVQSGGTLAPGNSPGLVTVNGNLTLGGTLEMELTDKNTVAGTDYDAIRVNGAATLGGTLRVVTFGSKEPVRGAPYTIISTTGGTLGQFSSVDAAGHRVLIVTPDRNADVSSTGYLRGMGSNTDVVIYVVDRLDNFVAHDGLGGLNAVLDDFILDPAAVGMPKNALGAQLVTTPTASLSAAVTGLSPLGYGALYAMDRETGLRQEEQIRSRLEQRRYDNAGERNDPWEAFVVGSGATAANRQAVDTPVFDYTTMGGLIGLDRKIEDGPVVGVAAGYDNGNATLHGGSGKITMSRVRGTAFLSAMVNPRWFVDATLSAGIADFDATRQTVTGRNTGSCSGTDFGASIATGTIVPLRSNLHLTPYVAASYAHQQFDAFTEKGSDSALAVSGWSNDSLRVSVGSGLGWFVPVADMKLKVGLDLAYNRELLDTESAIDARFARIAGPTGFRTTAAALPSDSISFGPNVGLGIDEASSVSAGYTFEYGFDGRVYNAFNVAYRRRF